MRVSGTPNTAVLNFPVGGRERMGLAERKKDGKKEKRKPNRNQAQPSERKGRTNFFIILHTFYTITLSLCLFLFYYRYNNKF
jgi:hypothetical protein